MGTYARSLVGVALLVSLPAGGRAQTSPLDRVPGTAPIVVQVRGWERAVGRMTATLKAAIPDQGAFVASQIEMAISGALNGRELKGLAKDGPLFLVFTEVPTSGEEPPDLAVVVRVTDYKQFRDGFLKDDERKSLKADKDGVESTTLDGKPVQFLSRGEYAVLALTPKALKAFQAGSTAPLTSRLAGPLAAKFLESDLSAYVDVRAVTKQFGDEIVLFRQVMDQVIEQSQAQGTLGGAQLDQVKKFVEAMFQLADDAEAVVAAVDFRPEGALLRFHTQVREKSKTNTYLKTLKPAASTALAAMPAGKMMYSHGTAGLEMSQALVTSMLGLGGTGDAAPPKDVEAALAELAALKVVESTTAADFPAGGLTVARYADPAKAVAASLKLYQALPANAAFGGTALKGKPVVREREHTAGDFTLHGVALTWDFDRMVQRFAEEQRDAMKDTLKKMLGDGQRFWFGTDGKVFVQLNAPDWPAAGKLLDAYTSGKARLGDDAAFAETRKQLPAEANALVVIDAGGFAFAIGQYLAEVLKNVPMVPFTPGTAKKPEGKPSYIGLALTLGPRNGAVDLYLPASGVRSIITVLQPLFGGAAGE